MSKIKRVTIITQQGTNNYTVGLTYEGLLLDRIVDDSTDEEFAYVNRFVGWTEDRQVVFEAINAPIDVAYCED